MLKLKSLKSAYGMKVYTDAGEYFGDVEEVLLEENKVSGWKIRATRGSLLEKTVEGIKGVVVPHQLVRAIADIIIVSRAALPGLEREEKEE